MKFAVQLIACFCLGTAIGVKVKTSVLELSVIQHERQIEILQRELAAECRRTSEYRIRSALMPAPEVRIYVPGINP